MSSDADWEEFARREPYFAILTDERFLGEKLDAAAMEEFFASGERDVELLLHLAGDPRPKEVLDFGCGAGRMTLAWARRAEHVAGIDAAPTMLKLARAHCEGLRNVELFQSLDDVAGRQFDFVASLIVFQHIPVARGEELFRKLLALLRRGGGVAAIHFTFARPGGLVKRLARRVRASIPLVHRLAQRLRGEKRDLPYMQMNVYDRRRIARIIREAGCSERALVPTSHGGIEGAIVMIARL